MYRVKNVSNVLIRRGLRSKYGYIKYLPNRNIFGLMVAIGLLHQVIMGMECIGKKRHSYNLSLFEVKYEMFIV